MKKSLIALAALAATASFAQSSVTISGTFDAGYKNVNGQDNTKDSKNIGGNNTATSNVTFAGTEDLGGGLKAEFKGVALINVVSGQTGNAADGSTIAKGAFSQNQNLFNDEIWVGLSGGFGAVKLGAPNSAQLETNGKVQPFGTAMGGGYQSAGVSRFLAASTQTLGVNQFVGGASANGRVVRHEKAVRYDTPNFNGFAASLGYAAKNANVATAGSTSNTNGYTDIGLTYANGPLTLAYANTKIDAGAYAAAGNNGTGALSANADVKFQMFGGNYVLGAATLYAGMTTAKSTGLTTNIDTKSWNVAAKYALNANVDLMVNHVKIDDKAAASATKDQKLTGLGVDYKLSKRTALTARYEDYNLDKSLTNGGYKTYALGVRHTF